jgi:DNA primase small subunit
MARRKYPFRRILTGGLLLDSKVVDFVTPLIKSYYSKAEGFAPPGIAKREFGFGDYEKKIAFRHYAFKDEAALRRYMVEKAPPFASYSTAFYQYPDARPMENKKLLGAELIFDLDSTDLRLPCQQEHGRDWICDKDLDAIKAETVRLVEDFLMPDFGFSEKDISINFSGNRGYHVHVNNDQAYSLSGDARKAVSGYISGTDMDLQAFFPTIGLKGIGLKGPKPADSGWGGRFAKGLITALDTGVGALESLGMEPDIARKLFRKRAEIIMGISVGNWDKVSIPKKAEFWKAIIGNMSIKQSDSIDSNVTKDMHHLIRMPNTLHGDTALAAKRIASLAELKRFEPMEDAIAFREGTVTVSAGKVQKFVMGGAQFGPYKNERVEVPTYAALYMLLKRVATL